MPGDKKTGRSTGTRTYNFIRERPDPDVVRSLTGLELLEKLYNGDLPTPTISATMGFTLETVEDGRAVYAAEPGDYLSNAFGNVHGGYAATLLDTAMGSAIHSTLPAGTIYTTVELKINYIRALEHDTGPIQAIGTKVHVGRSLATAEGRLIGKDDGKLYAHGSTTCLVLPMG